MDYELIYYTSGRTAEMERVLEKALSPIGLSQSMGTAATDKSELADVLSKGLKKSLLIFVIGGLNDGYDSTDKVLSKILVSNDENVSIKRIDGEKTSGYIIRSNEQIIVALPDEPEETDIILHGGIISELSETYSLTTEEEKAEDIGDVITKLDKELSQTDRVRLVSAPPKPRLYKRSRRAKIIIGILLTVGISAAIAAGILTLIYYILPYTS